MCLAPRADVGIDECYDDVLEDGLVGEATMLERYGNVLLDIGGASFTSTNVAWDCFLEVVDLRILPAVSHTQYDLARRLSV